MADKCWIVYGFLGAFGDPAFHAYNGTKWTFNKTRYRAHMSAIADAGGNAVRHLPTGGVWNGHPGNKKVYQFSPFKFVNENTGWDLSQWNPYYFDVVGQFIEIENSLGLTTLFCLADNCENNGSYKVYSHWWSNKNNVDGIYDTGAQTYFDKFIDKCLAEFSGMDILWSSGNEMNNSGFPALFNAVIHPLADAGTLNTDRLTYGTTKSPMTDTVRAYLQAADRNKVIMEVHAGPTSTGYKSRYAPWAGTGARMLFSDDGCYTGASTCDKTSKGTRPSAGQWYTAALDVLNTYGNVATDDYTLNFEHCPAGYTDFTKATSTSCQAATIRKIRQAYEEWAVDAFAGRAPTAPSNLKVVINGDYTATLTWEDNSNNETDFHIEKSTTSPGTGGFTEIATVTADVVTYETILGATLLSNGNFSTNDLTSWTAAAGWSASSGKAIHNGAISDTTALVQAVSLINGVTYEVSVVTSGTTAGTLTLTCGALTESYSIGSIGTTKSTFAATSTASFNLTFTPSATFNGGIDNITCIPTTATDDSASWFRVRAHNTTGYSAYTDIVKATVAAATSMPKSSKRISNLPYPFGFRSFEEVRDYLIKLRSKVGTSDFSVNMGDVILPGGAAFNFPMDGILYEMLTCDEEVLAWGWPGIENVYIGEGAALSMDGGSYNTLGGYGSGQLLTVEKGNTFYGNRSGYLVGDIEGTEETIESSSYDLKKSETGAGYQIFMPITYWDGQIVTLDRTDGTTGYNIVGSSDGVTWSTLKSSTVTAGGAWAVPGVMTSYKGSAWYSIYGDTAKGLVQQWDGAVLTGHHTSPPRSNTDIDHLYVWGGYLWAIHDITSGVGANSERVISYTTGSTTWTAISDYDTAAYYNYGTASSPVAGYLNGKTNRLFGFEDDLYWLCSRYNSVTSKWEGKILKWDGTSAFDVYATIAPTDSYLHVTGAVNVSGTVYLFMSELGSTGVLSATDYKLVIYTSTDMLTWTLWKDFGDIGFVCDVYYFNQRVFVNVLNPSTNYTEVYYLGISGRSLTKEVSITTNTTTNSGTFAQLGGYLYVGKRREIYRRTSDTWIQAIEPDDTFGSYNTFIGYGTGTTNLTGRFNTLLGTLADVANTEIENATAIGYRARVGDSNTIVLGGTGAYAVNVAIGKTSASERFDVSGNIKASGRLMSGQATGTSPLSVQSTTVVTNLNADMLDGKHAADFLGLASLTDPGADRIVFWDDSATLLKWLACGNSVAITDTTLDAIQDIRTSASPTFVHGTFTQATGTSPFTISSTTVNTNLNADMVDGIHASGLGVVVWSSIASNPGIGEYRIVGLRLNSSKHIVVTYDDVPAAAPGVYTTILSNPTSGEYRIKALRLDSSKRIVVLYDNVAET